MLTVCPIDAALQEGVSVRGRVVAEVVVVGLQLGKVVNIRQIHFDLAVVAHFDSAFERTVTREADPEQDARCEPFGLDVHVHVRLAAGKIHVEFHLDRVVEGAKGDVLALVEF